MSGKVEIIPPKRGIDKTDYREKKRVAAYARVSTTEEEQQDSYDSQKEHFEKAIKENPDWIYVGVFGDYGISGTTDKRPDFQIMIDMALNGEIDLILTKSISRFTRNVVDLWKYTDMLNKAGVDVKFEEEGISLSDSNGKLLLYILGIVAQMEVENTSAHIKHRLHSNMKDGRLVGGHRLLGYDLVDGQLVINEEEAETVRYIYSRYLEGAGGHTIAKELTAMGKKTKVGNSNWLDRAVLDILKNEKYKGELLQGKTISVDPIKKIRKINDNISNKYRQKNHHEAIVSDEDWGKVQEIIASRREVRGNTVRGTKSNSYMYPFSSMLECHYCGKHYKRHNQRGTNVWMCSTYSRKGKSACPYCKTVKEKDIEDSFVSLLKALRKEKNGILWLSDETFEKHLKATKKEESTLEKTLDNWGNKLNKLREKKDRLLELYLDGKIEKNDFDIKHDAILNDIERCNETINRINAHIEKNEENEKNVINTRKLIKENNDDVFNPELFKKLVDKVIIGDGIDARAIEFALKIDAFDSRIKEITEIPPEFKDAIDLSSFYTDNR